MHCGPINSKSLGFPPVWSLQTQDFRVGYNSKTGQEQESAQASNLSKTTDANKAWVQDILRRGSPHYHLDLVACFAVLTMRLVFSLQGWGLWVWWLWQQQQQWGGRWRWGRGGWWVWRWGSPRMAWRWWRWHRWGRLLLWWRWVWKPWEGFQSFWLNIWKY